MCISITSSRHLYQRLNFFQSLIQGMFYFSHEKDERHVDSDNTYSYISHINYFIRQMEKRINSDTKRHLDEDKKDS